jgi:acetyl-CoA synthetase
MEPAAAVRSARDFLIATREDSAAAHAGFRWPRLKQFNFALDWFDGIDPAGEALRLLAEDGARVSRTFGELARASNQLANFLREAGVERGDRVLLMLGNCVPLWEALLALMKLGAVMIPASPLLSTKDIDDRLARGEVSFVITASEFTDRITLNGRTGVAVGDPVEGWLSFAEAMGASADFAPDGPTAVSDPLLLYFTSGTTAKAKLVQHSHSSYPIGSLSTMYWIGLQPGDVHLNISSPGWAKHAWSSVFAPWLAEATVLVLDQERFDPRAALDALTSQKVTSFCAPPTVWRLLVQQKLGRRPPALRELVSAGEPLNPEVIAQVRAAWGLVIRDGFGQTETSALIANTPGQAIVEGSVGRPLPGFELLLLDGEGVEAGTFDPEGAGEGELAVRLSGARGRPVGVMAGYRVGGRLDPLDGTAYRTGDIARRDAAGYYTYVGRNDDVFKSSDYRISPFELESVLIEHPAVAEAAVVASPDPIRLAVPKAFIALAPGFDPSEALAGAILDHARAALGPFKRIRRVEFCTLPKTISGKIRRIELRQMEAERRAKGEQGLFEWSDDGPTP